MTECYQYWQQSEQKADYQKPLAIKRDKLKSIEGIQGSFWVYIQIGKFQQLLDCCLFTNFHGNKPFFLAMNLKKGLKIKPI